MRGKKLFALFVPLLILSMLAVSPQATTTATKYVDPAAMFVMSGDIFTLSVKIADAVDVFGYGFKLDFDPTLFTGIDAEYGGFLGDLIDPRQFTYMIDPFNGYVDVGCALLGAVPGVSGEGNLANIRFQARAGAQGTGLMEIVDGALIDSNMNPLPEIDIDGTVEVGLITPDICLWMFKKGASRAIWTEPSWIEILDVPTYVNMYGKIVNTGAEGIYVKVLFLIVDSSGAVVDKGSSNTPWLEPGGTVIVEKKYLVAYLGPGTFFVKGSVYFSTNKVAWRAYSDVEAELGGIGTARDVETTRFRVLLPK